MTQGSRRSLRALSIVLLVATLAIGGAMCSLAQPLDVEAMGTRGDKVAKTQLDLYTRIPYDRLSFLKASGGFEAHYEVAAEAYTLSPQGRKGRLVQSRLWDQTVRARSYSATQTDRAADATTQSLALTPGRYLIEFQLKDASSHKAYTRHVPVNVHDLSDDVAVSDLLLLDDFDRASNAISPNVTGRVETGARQVQFYYELYADEAQPLRITSKLVRVEEKDDRPSVWTALGLVDEGPDVETVFSKTERHQTKVGRSQVITTMSLKEARAGNYVLHLTVRNDSGRVLSRVNKPMEIQWSGLAEHVQQLDKAVAQLQYIAKDDEHDYIAEAPTRELEHQRFLAFWDKRDPTPSTERNERMENYYHRVADANDKYGTLEKGWQTDRGYTYILLGKPDQVERHPYNYNAKPYQVWYYYDVQRRLVFVDETGMGQYELLVPIWDERTRLQ